LTAARTLVASAIISPSTPIAFFVRTGVVYHNENQGVPMTKDTKTARFELRLTEAEKKALKAAAKAAQRTVADYLISSALPTDKCEGERLVA
jgi:hypothetical protein